MSKTIITGRPPKKGYEIDIKADKAGLATSAKQDDIINNSYPTGTGSNGIVTLTNANTAYAVPSTAPTGKYELNLYNGSGSDIYVGYENINTGGSLITTGGTARILLGANQQVYCYSATVGVSVNYSYKEI